MKQSAQSLSPDAQRLMFLVDTITEIVWEADLEGNIVYANKNWYEYSGMRAGSDISASWLEYIHPDDLESSVAAWQYSLDTGEPYEVEYRLLEKSSGLYNWFIVRANAFRNAEGDIERWYGTCTNVDPSKQNERLTALNRSKDEFISIASHQLRTPATGVKQYLGMLLDDMFGEISDTQRDILKRAYSSNERQLRIISDLLKVAQLDAGDMLLHPVTTDLSELTHYIIQDMSSVFKERNQSLEYRPYKGKHDALAFVDAESIRMVIENVIDNASKYSPEDTTVAVAIKRAKPFIEIIVSDQGVGIDPEYEDTLFERFARIDNPLSTEVGGTGLGLYWAHQVVMLHSGEIAYHANQPRGSVFTIRLPIKGENVTNLTENS